MKKLFLIALLFAGFTAQAQFADEKPLSSIDNEFIQIWITQSKSGSLALFFTEKIIISLLSNCLGLLMNQ